MLLDPQLVTFYTNIGVLTITTLNLGTSTLAIPFVGKHQRVVVSNLLEEVKHL